MMSPDNTETPTSGSQSAARLETAFARHRFAISLTIHGFIFALSLLLSYIARFDIGLKQQGWFMDSFLPWVPAFVGVKLLVFGIMGQFRADWTYAGVRDLVSILIASWISVVVIYLPIVLFLHLPAWTGKLPLMYFKLYPQGVVLLDFFATVFLVCTARLGFRLYMEELRPVSPEGLKRVLIIGAGHAAEVVIREIHRMRVGRYRVVGLVDDDPAKQRMSIHGTDVLGTTADIPALCEEYEVDEIIISIPSANQKELRRIIELCGGTKLNFQSLPSVGDLIDGSVTVSQIRPVDIEDLLGREAVELNTDAIGRFLNDRRILITGAGGSIGSEMCRQICHFRPEQLILVEQAETPLYDIQNELRETFPDIPLFACICDIEDRERVMAVWENFRPHVVVHAAAHKHVPLMEHNPCEAIKNNIFGTKNVADACCEHRVAEFVLISTDKAVNPSSVMGATKRVAEIYTQGLNGRDSCETQFKAVRFGNVLGSAGSVVPVFRKQIAAGGPVRVTHPEMQRYFMTIPEASQLVLQAAATGSGGQIFLLDMGEPVKIVDLARQMITLSGFRPDEDIDIVFTGVRPGEKLFEELRTEGENIEPTVHPKVNIWQSRPIQWDAVQAALETFDAARNAFDRNKVVAALRNLVPEYEPLNPPDSKDG